MPLSKEKMREYQRRRRAEKKEFGLVEKEAVADDNRDLGKDVAVAVVPPAPVVHVKEMLACPAHIDPKEWKYALERAGRARKYAEMFPSHVRPSEERFQDPVWQWENEVRGRFGGIVGGSLSGTRSGDGGN